MTARRWGRQSCRQARFRAGFLCASQTSLPESRLAAKSGGPTMPRFACIVSLYYTRLNNFVWAIAGSLVASLIAAGAPVDFQREIAPIFESRCYSCHGPERQANGLRLDQKTAA